MATIDLRQFIVNRAGQWTDVKDESTLNAALLKLSRAGDLVTLNGPLSVRVTVQVRNQFTLANQRGVRSLAIP